MNEEIFDSMADARRKLALWRYDNNVRPHSSLANKTPAEERQALELSEGSAPGSLAQPETDQYQPQGLSLCTRDNRGQVRGSATHALSPASPRFLRLDIP